MHGIQHSFFHKPRMHHVQFRATPDVLGLYLLQRPRGGRSCVLQGLALPHTTLKGMRRLHEQTRGSASHTLYKLWGAGCARTNWMSARMLSACRMTTAVTGIGRYLWCRV